MNINYYSGMGVQKKKEIIMTDKKQSSIGVFSSAQRHSNVIMKTPDNLVEPRGEQTVPLALKQRNVKRNNFVNTGP